MATGVGVNWPFTQAIFCLSLGFNNKKPFDSIEETCGEGQKKIFGAVLDIYWIFLPRVNSQNHLSALVTARDRGSYLLIGFYASE